MRGSLTNASKKYDVTGFLYFNYKQAKLVRPDEPKSKIWGVLGGYPLMGFPYFCFATTLHFGPARTTDRNLEIWRKLLEKMKTPFKKRPAGAAACAVPFHPLPFHR